MTTEKTLAQSALYAISRKCFGGKNYNNEFWYEVDPNVTNEYVLGTVYKIEEKGKSKEIGKFEIEPNGYISTFPGIPNEVIIEINEGKESPPPVDLTPERNVTEVHEEPKKKRRGRPRKTDKQD